MTNSADLDQLASEEANWSGSTLFAKTGHVVLSKRRVKRSQLFLFGVDPISENMQNNLDHCLLQKCISFP